MGRSTVSGPWVSENGFVGNQVDSNGNEIIVETGVASAVNEITVTNAITGVSPSITASGADTNVGLRLGGKATGQVSTNGALTTKTTATTINTAGAVTLTAAQLLGGLILRDCNGAGRADVVPTAALMVAAVPGAVVGDSFRFIIRNTSAGATTITLTPDGAATTISGTATIAQNNQKEFLLVLTNVTASSEAYTVYSMGTVVF